MLTQERLKELLHYDPLTGLFTRLKTVSNFKGKKGDIAGSISDSGYIVIRIDRKIHRSHRLAHLYMNGEIPFQVDHSDHDRKNNKWINIETGVTNHQNSKNQSIRSTNSSGINGVGYRKKCTKRPWIAQIMVNSKCIILGYFTEKSEAIKAREAANIKYGFHPNHGASK